MEMSQDKLAKLLSRQQGVDEKVIHNREMRELLRRQKETLRPKPNRIVRKTCPAGLTTEVKSLAWIVEIADSKILASVR